MMKRSSLTPVVFVLASAFVGGALWAAHSAERDMRPTCILTSSIAELPGTGVTGPKPMEPKGVLVVSSPASQASLSLDRTSCVLGQQVTFEVTGDPSWDRQAWVGVIPAHVPHGSADVNDRHDLSYAYMEGRSAARMTLPCPRLPGAYTLRLHDAYSGREVVSAPFEAKRDPDAVDVEPLLVLKSPKTIINGRRVEVEVQIPDSFGDDAWIGVIPSEIPHGSGAVNDQHDTDYAYVKKGAKQTLFLNLPRGAGAYDVRLHTSDAGGQEVKSVSFRTIMRRCGFRRSE